MPVAAPIAGGLAAGAAGALLSKNGSSGGTTTQSSDPWWGAQPYMLQLYERAQNNLQTNPVLGQQSPYTTNAISQIAANATNPNSLVSRAQTELGNTIDGQGYNAPWIQAAADAARRNISAQFSGDNYGSSANQEWLAKTTAGAVAPLLAQERQNQMSALGMAPALQMANTQQLLQAGGLQDSRSQAEADSNFTALQRYQSLLGGSQGYGTQTSPYFTNPLANALGLGLGGLQLYNGMNRAGIFGGGGNNASYTTDGTFAPFYNGYGAGGYQYG